MNKNLYNNPPLNEIVAAINASFNNAVITFTENPPEDDTIYIQRNQIRQVCQFLKEDNRFKFVMLSDLTCIDMLAHPDWHPDEDYRFEVVYQLYSLENNRRLRLKVRIPEDDARVESVVSVWRAADWLEREVWEMFGIEFVGHPNLKHLLLWDGFKGHPLRKDYHLKGHQPLIELRKPIKIKEEPSHQRPEFEREFFRPLPIDEITKDNILPESMLIPDWKERLAAKRSKAVSEEPSEHSEEQ